MIGSIAPKYGYRNSLTMLLPNDSLTTAWLVANLNVDSPSGTFCRNSSESRGNEQLTAGGERI